MLEIVFPFKRVSLKDYLCTFSITQVWSHLNCLYNVTPVRIVDVIILKEVCPHLDFYHCVCCKTGHFFILINAVIIVVLVTTCHFNKDV